VAGVFGGTACILPGDMDIQGCTEKGQVSMVLGYLGHIQLSSAADCLFFCGYKKR